MIRKTRPRVALARCLPLLGLLAGCATQRGSAGIASPDREVRPIEALVEASKKAEPIGKFLADTNSAIKAWNNLLIAASTEQEKARARDLELHIQTVTHQRRVEVVTELESGPLNNRIVAAAALGFTRDVEAQGPLIAALEDNHDEVVSSALLGLWLLGRTDTPLERVCPLMSQSRNDEVRSNAALLMAFLTQADEHAGECALQAARLGLLDTSATVRAHCAMVIANCKDSGSLQALVDRLYDEKPLVVSAAARAITYLGTSDAHIKGSAARALVKAWIAIRTEPQKSAVFRTLVELAQSNYGSDEKEWIKWAERLP